jgi:DNA-directed RNA polymerase beta subunit
MAYDPEDAAHWPHYAQAATFGFQQFADEQVPLLFKEILGIGVRREYPNHTYNLYYTDGKETFVMPAIQEDGTLAVYPTESSSGLSNLQRRFIPLQLRYKHNQILYFSDKDGNRRVEYRAEYPNKPGRSTSTVTFDGASFTVSFIKASIPARQMNKYLVHEVVTDRDKESVQAWFRHDVIPGSESNRDEVIHRMIEAWNDFQDIDPNDMCQMAIDTPSMLLAQLLRMKLNEAKARGNWTLPKLSGIVSTAILTGRWSATRRGVTCALKTTNQSVIESQVRRVMARQAHTRARLIASRMPHPSTFGFLCVGETPDGKNCGLQLTLAAGAKILQPYCGQNITRMVRLIHPPTACDTWVGSTVSDEYLTPAVIKSLRDRGVPFVFKDEPAPAEVTRSGYVREVLSRPHLSREMASVPFLEMDQGPRAYFQAMMRRQFISADPPADPDAHLRQYLTAGQSPLVGGEIDSSADGLNLVVAVLAHNLNMEDCLLVNQRAVDLGAFHTLVERGHVLRRSKRREKIEECLLQKRQRVNERDVIAKSSEQTIRAKHDEAGTVVSVAQTPDSVKVVIREEHIPADGDKLSNRHGQKGVVRVIPCADMPWCPVEGIIPDAVINPFAFPSRMTMGMMMELIIGRKMASSESLPDPFREGQVRMCVGETGAMITVPVTVGVCWYGRMEQISKRKINVRGGSGPTDSITGQPKRGRRVDGGAKFSLMDANAALAHGANDFVYDRMVESSDPYTRHICSKCMLPATRTDPKQPYSCRHCKSALWVKPERTARSTVVMMNELAADGISTRLL